MFEKVWRRQILGPVRPGQIKSMAWTCPWALAVGRTNTDQATGLMERGSVARSPHFFAKEVSATQVVMAVLFFVPDINSVKFCVSLKARGGRIPNELESSLC